MSPVKGNPKGLQVKYSLELLTPGDGELTKRKLDAGKLHVRFDERSEGESPRPTTLLFFGRNLCFVGSQDLFKGDIFHLVELASALPKLASKPLIQYIFQSCPKSLVK
ncbi:hypothetical protein EBO34_18990 [Alteribacter keqinensis]|uniref:Uncharacterized protein n=1 Tax=Alteribacter keqinensis TaxID=2483800 RepID=A0A3M7TL07_9BACI|nr:hypothetical protein EBO34_18990 [Alteribacter keqinensis]